MHDYKKSIDFNLLRRIYINKEMDSGEFDNFNCDLYEEKILQLENNEISFGTHHDFKNCEFCTDEEDINKKIVIEDILAYSYNGKYQFKKFKDELEEADVLFRELHEQYLGAIKNNTLVIHRKVFYKIKEDDTNSCTQNGRTYILQNLFLNEEIRRLKDVNIFKDYFSFYKSCRNDRLYHLCLHPINPFQYILENDLHYKLYKGFEDILNEYEHNKN
jgi:hypothetical protein